MGGFSKVGMGVGVASAGISLGLFIGVAASFVYIILAGIKWASERLDPPQDSIDIDRCARCGCKFVDHEDGTCSMCDLTICAHCSIQYQQAWLCATCIRKRDEDLIGNSWVLSKFRERIDGAIQTSKYGRREGDVRDFVEKLTENILGGRLDDVRIDHITEDPQYVHFMDKYEDVLSLTLSRLITAVQLIVDGVEEKKESPRKVHDQLKSLVSDIIVEASSLKLRSDWEGKSHSFGTKTYEDILATAILNKIVQNVTLGRFHPYVSPKSNNCERVGVFGDDLKNQYNIEQPQGISCQGNTYENLGFHSRKNSEMGVEFDVDIFDELLYGKANPDEGEAWKENWVLEKKSNESSVAMLIPSPNGKAKPLIGDLEIDQLSDLSDIEDEHFVLKENTSNSTNYFETNNVSLTNKMNGNTHLINDNRKTCTNYAEAEDINHSIPKMNGEPKHNGRHYNSWSNHSVNSKSDIDISSFSIVEAKNSVFSSNELSSDDENTKKEKDRDYSEVTHQNTTKVTLCHMESRQDLTLEQVCNDRISVRQLAKQFSKGATPPQQNHSVHSLTGRNLARDFSVSPLHSNIEYWEKLAKKE